MQVTGTEVCVILGLIALAIVAIGIWLSRRKKQSHKVGKIGRIISRDVDVSSPDGFKVVASAGPERKPLPPSHDQIRLIEHSRRTKKYACGHSGYLNPVFDVYGLETRSGKETGECPDCTVAWCRKHVIRCSLCGLPIFPGSSVALYSLSESSAINRRHATTVGDNAAIGCLRWDCCPAGGFFAGHWSEDGFVPFNPFTISEKSNAGAV